MGVNEEDQYGVHVYYSRELGHPRLPSSVLEGLEEEGVPAVVEEKMEPASLQLSWEAALASRLGVGIGIGTDGQIMLHYKKLDPTTPLFTISQEESTNQRVIGANAARLVKGIPFQTFMEKKENSPPFEKKLSREEITVIVELVIQKLHEKRKEA
ncbi:glycerol dehydratase reactivase beta/small subunit family protein [Bacillus piscicola]|uniref:glycerol dehydratase reactivase beta/small subunit family protein n=1 Tax=Bacillus piscicola TaxID=1632684 RepID=UPI001F09D61A